MEIMTIIWIAITLIALIGLIAITMLAPYKHRIRIKQVYGNKNYVIDEKFREIRKPEGVFWKLLKRKELISPAPDQVIEVGKKGRMIVTAYEVEKGCYTWQEDDLKSKIPDQTVFINQTQPLTTTQRTMYMAQAVKAQREKKKTTSELIAAAAPTIGIIIIVAVFLLFFNEAVKPINEAASTAASVSEDFKIAAQAIAGACNPQPTPVALNNPIPDDEEEGEAS